MTIPRLVGSLSPAAAQAGATELLVLLPSLGTSSAMWDGVVSRLRPTHQNLRVLSVDLPGHGVSPVARHPFSISELAAAVLQLVDDVGGGSFWVAGVSLGGVIALELALQAPQRVRGFAMFSSGSSIGTAEGWAARVEQVRRSGTASLVTASAERWFAEGFLANDPHQAGAAQLSKLVDVDDESYALDVEALAAFDRSADLGQLRVPAVFVSGEFDLVTTPEQMSQLADQVAGSRSVELAGVSHLSVIEAPDAAAHEIARLLADSAQGMRTRRAVLGDAHVDRATAAATAETQPFQDFITRYAWGEIWSRTELSRRDRSIATLAVLVADSHESELRMHIRAALRNGLTRTEIAEVIMHTALYAGLPPANSALAVMREVFENLEADETDQPDQPVQTEQEGSR